MLAETESEVETPMNAYINRMRPLTGDEHAAETRRSLVEHMLVDTPDQVIEQLEPWVAAGLASFTGYCPNAAYGSASHGSASLEMLARRVAPEFARRTARAR